MDEIALMREIARLQEQINALRTIEIGGVWQNWTPTVTSGTGTITSYTVQTAQYMRLGVGTWISLIILLTNAGTAGSTIIATLPHSATRTCVAIGREDALTGKILQGKISGGTIAIFDYINNFPGGTGSRLVITGFYL